MLQTWFPPNWVSVSLVLIKSDLQSQFDRLVVGNGRAWHRLCGLDSPTCCGITLQTSVFRINHTTPFSGLELLSSPCVRHMQGFGVVLQWYFKGLHCVCWHPWLQDSWTSCGAKGQLKTCWKDGRLISLAVQHTGVSKAGLPLHQKRCLTFFAFVFFPIYVLLSLFLWYVSLFLSNGSTGLLMFIGRGSSLALGSTQAALSEMDAWY